MPLPRIRREFLTSLRRLKETIKRTNKSSKRERETPLQIERLEERQMLAGDLVTIFQTSFEEISVEPGGYKFTQEVGGFEATGRSVELQNNHPSVGPASDGQNLLELDGVNGIAVEIDNVPPAGMILRVDYSPRPGIGAPQNTVEVLWNGTLIESISDNGRKKKTTDFRTVEIMIPGSAGTTTGRLEFRSNSPEDAIGMGGLIDNVRLLAEQAPIAIAAIDDQEVGLNQTIEVDADLAPPDDQLEGVTYQLVQAPVGATIDPQTGLISWTASEANIDATVGSPVTEVGPRELLFQAGFEDVDVESGGYGFFREVSGFTSLRGRVEVQDNHPAVGAASEGQQHLELDVINGIYRDVATVSGDRYELVFDFSPRAGVDPVSNAIEVWWDGQLIDTVTADGRGNSGTAFRSVTYDLSQFSGDLTRLEFRSNDPDDTVGLGGLIDNVRVYRREVTVTDPDRDKFRVVVRATDTQGRTDTESFNFCVIDNPVDQPPAFLPTANRTINELQPIEVFLKATDPDTPVDELRFEAVRIPVNATLDAVTGKFSWTPNEWAGGLFFNIDVKVTDTSGLSDTQRFRITVNEVNSAPTIVAIDDIELGFADSLQLNVVATDSDRPLDSLSFALIQAPAGATISDSGEINWDPFPAQTGSVHTFEVWVGDGKGGTDTEVFHVRFVGNTDPVLAAISDQEIDETDPFSLQAIATDAESPPQTLTYSLVEGPPEATIEPLTGVIQWTPSEADGPGEYTFKVRVDDGAGGSDERMFNLVVNEVNTAPVLDPIADQSIEQGQTLQFTATATDADIPANQLEYGFSGNVPMGASIDPDTGEFSWTPTTDNLPGTYQINVTVSDGQNASDMQTVNIMVTGSDSILLRENSDFQSTYQQSIIVSDDTPTFQFQYARNFDQTDDFVNDAFEVALLDADGNSLVHTIAPGRDAFFNFTESQQAEAGVNTLVNGGTIKLDLSHLANGTEATVVFRLVNNDADTETVIRVFGIEQTEEVLGTPAGAVTPEVDPQSSLSVDLDSLTDVTGSLKVNYRATSFDDDSKTLFTDVELTNLASQPIDGPFVLVVSDLSDTGVAPIGAAGKTADGDRFYLIGPDQGSNTLAPGASTVLRTLRFFNPNQVRFDFTLNVLAQPNRAPEFTSKPNSEGTVDRPYIYDAVAKDPDGDALAYALLAGPTGMTINANSGQIEWAPTLDDVGTHDVIVEVQDGRGGRDRQNYDIEVLETRPNRPPIIVSTPVVETILAGRVSETVLEQADRQNLIYNGDFEAGNAGFRTDLSHSPTSITSQGQYAIVENPASVHNAATSYGDNRGDGLMMAVNGSGVLGEVVWEQTVSVERDTDHDFAAWISSWFPASPANLEFAVNGEVIGELQAPELAGNWVPVFATWNSGNATIATIQIRNSNQSFLGNDFALDDLYFGATLYSELASKFIELTPDQVGSEQNDVFSTLPTADPTVFGFPPSSTVVNFDVDPFGNAIASGSFLTTEYESVGVVMNNVQVTSSQYGGPASSPNTTFTAATPGEGIVFDFAVPMQAVGFINTSPDQDLVEFFDSDGKLIYSTTDQLGEIKNFNIDRFIGFTADADRPIASVRVSNNSGNLELDELIFAPVEASYEYQVEATDPDFDPIKFQLDEAPTGMIINPATGLISWTPTGQQVGTHHVIVTASDGQGGVAVQEYDVRVLADPTNSSPQIVSDPVDDFFVPGFANPASGNVSTQRISLDLGNGETFEGTVSITLPDNAARFADIVIAVDESQSMGGDQDWVGQMIPLLDDALVAQGIGSEAGFPNRFAIVGFGGGVDGVTVGHFLNPEQPTEYVLYGPDGEIVSQGALNSVVLEELLNLTLPDDGEYILVVNAANPDDLESGINVNVGGLTGDAVRIESLTVGATIDDRIAIPGQPVEYQFELTTAGLLYFDSQAKDSRIQWSLIGPEGTYFNQIPFDRALNAFSNPVVKALPGSYRLVIDSSVDVAADYRFQLLDLTTAPEIQSGVPTSTTFETNRETYAFQFEVGDNQQVSIDQVIDVPVHTPSEWKLVDNAGNIVAEDFLRNDRSPMGLPAGTYYLLLESELTPFEGTSQLRAPGMFTTTVEVMDTPAATPIELGETMIATLGFEQDFEEFTLSVAEFGFYSIDALTNSVSTWELIDRNDRTIQARRFDQTDAFGGENFFELAPGEYLFRVQANGVAGEVPFRVLSLAAATPIVVGMEFSGDLPTGLETEFYQFDAVEGEALFINAVGKTAGSLVYRLYDQYGSEIVEVRNFTNNELTIPRNGTYFLSVEGYRLNTEPLTFTFNVIKPVIDTKALSLDSVITETMSGKGDQFVYEFSLTEDKLLNFDALTNDASLRWTLQGPSGSLASNLSFTQAASENILDARAGDYRLTIDGVLDRTGAFSFALLDLDSAEAIVPNPGAVNPSVVLENPAVAPNQTKIYQFNADSGDEFSLITTVNGSNQSLYRVVDQFGVEIFDQTGISTDRLNVNFVNGGTYYLLLEGRYNDTTPEDYEIEIAWIQNNGPRVTSGTPINFGDVIAGSLDAADQVDPYTFTLNDRSLFAFDSLVNNSNIRWQLEGPQGIVANGVQFSRSDSFNNSDSVYDLVAGDYELRVYGSGTPGAYQFRALDLSDSSPIVYGTPFAGQLDLPNQTNTYQFDGSAGDRIFIDVLLASDPGNSLYRVYDQYGQVVLQQSSIGDNGNLELPTDGTYYLLVEGWIANTGLDSYEIVLQPIVDEFQTINVGDLVSGQIATRDGTNSYQFSLTERTPVTFDSLTNSSQLRWSLDGPAGTFVTGRRFDSSDAWSGVENVVQLGAGDYTVTVSGPKDIRFDFRLLDITNSDVIDKDTVVSDQVDVFAEIPPTWTTGVFTGDATNGALDLTSDLAAVQLPNEVLDGHAAHTVEFWYKTNKTGLQSFISAANQDDDNELLIYLQNHTDFRVHNVGIWSIDSIADEQWHHFAVVSEQGVGTTFYLDGVSQGSRTGALTELDLADGVIYFGQEQDAFDSRLDRTQTADGILDELRFWSVARSETEIADNLGATIPVDSAGLTAYYKLDETSGRTVSDATANGLNATAVTLSPNSSTQVYGFDVEAGQEVLIDLLSQEGFVYTPNLQLVDEHGRRILHEEDGELGPLKLDAGRYYVLVEGEPNDYFANGRYDLEISVISDPAVANDAVDLNLDEVVQGEFLKRFQTDRFAFTLSEQSTLAFDSLTDSATLTWSIVQDGITLIDNRRFDLSDAYDRDDTAFVLSAGDYELQVFSPLRERYAFQLIDLQSAEMVNVGETQTGVVIPADQSRAFQFDALDSESIFVDFANPSPNANLAVKLFDASGKLLFHNDRITDMDSIAIGQSGTHYLLLEGWPGNPETTVDFTVTKTQTTTSAIALDEEIVGTIAQPGDRLEYTFELTDAEKLYFDSLTTKSGIEWSLARDGINVVSNVAMNRNVNNDPLPGGYMLPGAYTLTVDGVGDFTGEFAFRLLQVDSALELDGNTAAGELTRGNETDLFRFNVDAGDRFFFDVTVPATAAEYRLMNSLGNTVARFSSLVDQELQFEFGGQYFLLIEGRSTSNTDGQAYAIDVIELAPRAGGTLNFGTPISDTIAAPGDRVAYQFQLTEHTYLHFDRLDGDNSILWSLEGPAGEQISMRRFDRSDSTLTGGANEPAVAFAARPGSYTLTVQGDGDQTGDFSFSLYDLLDDSFSTEIVPVAGTPATIDGPQVDPQGTQIFRFQAQAGDTFSFVTSTNGSVASDYKLVDQYGQQIFESPISTDQNSFLLDRAGTYYLLIEGRANNADVDEYQIVVSFDGNTPQPGFSGTAIDLGTAQAGSIDASDQVDRFTFTLTDRTLVHMDGLSNNTSIYWTLRGPRGIEINNQRLIDSDAFRTSDSVFELLAGDYELSMYSSGSVAGAYSFMLQDLSTATPVDSQTLIDGEFTVPAETDIYRIDVTEATDLFVDVVTSNDVNAGWIRVVDQFGASLGNSNRMRDNNFILPAAGRYYILVEGTYNNTGLDTYQLFVTPPTVTNTDLNFGLNQGEIAVQAQEFEYDFNLAERATLFMLPTTGSNSIHWSIVSDLGEVYQATDFSDGIRVIELEAGDYTLVVDGEEDAVESFDFTVIVGNGTSGLGLNGNVSQAILDQNAPVTAFRFNGNSGQHFSLVPDLSVLFTDSAVAAETAGKYVTAAQPEDGYSGIDVALRADVFRDGAAINYIVVTDEDRDNQDDNVTFESLFGGLSGQSALLNVVVASQFWDENDNLAIGVDYQGNAYLADGSGGFTVASGGYSSTNNVSIRNDYIDLAWALNGASWDLGRLRAGGVSAESFTNAFIDVKVDEILKQTALRLFPSNPAVDFEWVNPDDGTYLDPVGGQTYDFDIRIGNNGQPISYDLLFSQGQAVGSIPVFIISPYEYGAAAVDPDGDQLIWSLVQAPDGMIIDANTGVLAWTAEGVSFGEHQITIRVDDGRGGFDQQTFLLDVNGGEPATISGTILDVDTINDRTVGAVVVGSSDPWLAGMPDGSLASAGDNAPDHSPILVEDLDFIPGTTMTFSANGWVNFNGDQADQQTPDGGTLIVVHGEGAENGISDYKVPVDALIGVFLTEATPDQMEAPDALNFVDNDGVPGGINYTALAPELQQVFFIGDGFTDGGVQQQITIPEGATRLFLGTSDSFGWYNNIGFFEVEITAPVYAPVPENLFTVFLDQNRNGLRDPNEKFTTTDAQGNYAFDSLAAGSYVVRTEAVAGYRPFNPIVPVQEISVAPGEAVEDVLFRVEQVPVNNTNPEITSLPPTRIEAGNDFVYDPTIVELDGDDLRFDLPLAPAGMVVNPQTGAIRWTPQTDQVGIQNVLLRVRDDFGGFDLQYFEVEVLEPNSAPVITSVAPTGPAGVGLPYQYDVNALDANGDTIAYSLVESPAGMTINTATGLLEWTPTADDVGVVDIVVRAADSRGLSSDQAFTLSVELNPENAVPEFTTEPPTSVRLGDRYLYRIGILDVNGDPLMLEFVDGPEGMSFDGDDQLLVWEPTASQLGTQDVTLRLSDGRGGVAEQSFGIEVETQPVNFPPQITTPPVTVAIADQPYQFDADAFDANNDPLVWTLDQAPVGMTVDPLTGLVNWNPSTEEIGEHQVILQVIDPQGAFSQVVYTLQVRAVNSPPVVLSTPPTIAAVGASYLYQVGAEDADQDRLTFALLSGPDGMSINADTGVVEWSPVAGQEGAADVTIRVSDPLGAFADQSYTIQVGDGSDNRLPVITSTPGFFATLDQVYEYQVEATDPDGDPLVFEFLNGPDGVSLDANTGLLTFTPEVDDLGTNIIQLAARDPSGGGSLQTFSLTVLEENNAPEISSTPPTELASGQPFRYDVLATDADGDFLTYNLIEGPDGMVIDGVGRMFWIPGADQIGDNDVRIRVSDPQGGFAEQSFTVAVAADTTAPLVAILLSDNPVDVGSIVDIRVSSVDNVGVESLLLTIDGVAVPLDADGRARVELDTVGSVTAVATATDAAGNQGTDEIEIFVADPNDVDGPVISIASPADGGAITAPTDVIGTVIDDTLVSYTLYLGDFKTRTFEEIGSGDVNVDNDVLGTIDPTLLPNDSYILRLEAIDAGGNISVIEQQVEVTGELKLGNFRQSFTDLVIPVSGIPVQVTRVYDSLRANREGEFGFGWNLEYRDTNLTVSLPSTGLESSGIFPAFRPGVKVYVSLPGQERMGFTFAPEISGLPGGLVLARPRFIADPGVNSTMSVANRGYLTVNQFGELYAGGAIPYNPASPDFGGGFTVTTRDGIRYNIDGISGLLKTVVDRNGNTITFDNSGISSDAGSVVFERDSQGRIVSIVDLAGQKIEYQYSEAGDLASVIDREGVEVTFGYNEDVPHYLESIIDPLGREGARMEYGDDGRLNTIRNVRGGEVELVFDPDNFVLEQRDPLGGVSLLEYDEFGNVVSITDPAGNQTFQQFDANGNLAAITDSLGNTTTYERNARGDVIAEIDALGNVTQIGRDNFGNATSLSDPLGNTVTLEYDEAGNLTHRTDAEGNVTELSYDSRGNVVAATDENGSTETMEYDSFGNVVKVTDRRGFERINTYDANGMNTGNLVFVENEDGDLVEYSVQRQLDANGNVINLIGVDGSSVQTEYDELGRPISYVDQLGRQYTMSGNDTPTPELVTGPGGERLEYQFDLADRTTAIENQNGFVETYEYNDVGNLTKRILPDDTPEDLSDNPFMEFEYDALQRVIAIIDANGNRSEIEYDEVGNRILERDPLGNEIKREYDQARRLVRLEDQLGRVTTYQYDQNGQLVESVLPNGLAISFQYDSVGNVIRQTDSRGVVNSYTYDQDNNLIEVVDGNGHRTVYAYDRFGNLISQVDPNGNATTFEYDLSGQRTAIERPLGQRATFTYTDDFKLASETSFDGRTHQFIYDEAGRLVRADYADGRSFSAEYDTLGNIVKSTDSRGDTTFAYDAENRLVQKTEPDGQTIQYQYDGNSNIVSVTTSSGETTYEYDALNRMTSVTDTDGNTTQFAYDQIGNLVSTTYPNGIVESRTYDVQDLVASIELQDANGVLYTIEYVRDIVGNILSIDDSRGTLTEFEYDAELQLVKETITTGAGSRVIQYVYDAFGNRVQKIDSSAGTTTYTYDANDRLLESSGSETISYAYDANGNLISESSDGGTLTTYQWNARDELTGVHIEENGETTEIEYQYDLAGNRVSISVDGNQVNYLVDVTRELPVVLAEYSEVGITREFVYSDRIISSETGSGDLIFHHGDHINSVIAQTDTSSTLVSEIGRDSFGNVLSLVGLESDFGLSGEPVDATTGLTYLRARNLDTQTGRFISTDPFDGVSNNPASLHRYLYAENNPLVNVDPTGEYTLTQIVVGLGVGGALLAISQQVIGNLIARTTGTVNWAGSSIGVNFDTGDFTVGGTGLAIPLGVQLNRMATFNAPQATENGGLNYNRTNFGASITVTAGLSISLGYDFGLPVGFSAGGFEVEVPRLLTPTRFPSISLAGGYFLADITFAAIAGYTPCSALAMGFGRGNASGPGFTTFIGIASSINGGVSLPILGLDVPRGYASAVRDAWSFGSGAC